jgi:hypothetical protein
MPVSDETRREFEKWGKALPTTQGHGTETDIRENLRKLNLTGWYLSGNELRADTELGPFVQMIPTDYICKGVDEEGLPILVKVVVKK